MILPIVAVFKYSWYSRRCK